MKYFTVGPSQLHPKFRTFLDDALAADIPSISHRSGTFSELFAGLRDKLTKLVPVGSGYQTFYCGSATEFMERAVQNMSERTTVHFVGGAFGKRFHGIAGALGRNASIVLQGQNGGYSLDDVHAELKPELICVTQNETSNGTMVTADFFNSLKARFPDALLAVDVVSSAPVFPSAFAAADCIFFSVQKCFGLPAGLGVALVNERAIEKARSVARANNYTGSFHSFEKMAENARLNRTSETPNVLAMYLLGRVCDDYLARGIENLQKETDAKAEVLYTALRLSKEFELSDCADMYRSRTVVVAKTPGGSKPAIERLKAHGFLIHSGYSEEKETHVRIANFPTQTLESVRELAELLKV